jgi:hypothetical protein
MRTWEIHLYKWLSMVCLVGCFLVGITTKSILVLVLTMPLGGLFWAYYDRWVIVKWKRENNLQ